MIFLLALGGAIGALMRHLIVTKVTLIIKQIKMGLLFVNLLGSALLGIVFFADQSSLVNLLLGMALCGALTTFSSLIMEMVHLIDHKKYLAAGYVGIIHLVGSFTFYLAGHNLSLMTIQ